MYLPEIIFKSEEKAFYLKELSLFKVSDQYYMFYLLKESIKIIKQNGLYGLIIPNAWYNRFIQVKNMRKYILETCKLNQILNLTD